MTLQHLASVFLLCRSTDRPKTISLKTYEQGRQIYSVVGIITATSPG